MHVKDTIFNSSTDRAGKFLEAVSRMGYVAKGLVFVIVGVLAALAAIGLGGQATDTKGAVRELASQPYGQLLLLLLAAGLAGHTLWRVTQAWADTEHKGRELKGVVARAGFLISGAVYAGLAFYTLDRLTDVALDGGSGDETTQSRTATLLSLPGGNWLVAAIGLVFLGVSAYQARRAHKRFYRKAWDTAAMSNTQSCWADRIARTGLASRALVFALIGAFFIAAAIRHDPNKAEGLGGTLQTLAQQPYGWVLLGLTAVGLICYGIYCFANARYRNINLGE